MNDKPNPKLVQALWDAFPAGFIDVVGTTTLGGQWVVTGKNGLPLWWFPVGGTFHKPGMPEFDEARSKLSLLPDPENHVTRLLLRHMLAERAALDPTNGVLWTPKAKETVDRSRMATGKGFGGWSLRTLTRHVTFPMDERDGTIGLLKAIHMTNCACGRGPMRACPVHGDSTAKPWR